MENLSKDTLVSRVMNAQAAGTAPVNGTILDMAGYEGVMFVALLNTVVDTSALGLQAFENSANSTAGAVAVTGANATFTALGSSNGMLITDVIRPAQRYVYPVLSRTVANATVDGVVAIRYRARKKPVALDATVLAAALSTPEA